MSKKLFLLAVLATILGGACQSDHNKASVAGVQALQLITAEESSATFENLRLYPVIADPSVIAEHKDLNRMKTLAEGMNTPGFRLLERKQFGKQDEAWHHGLTVQNKSQDTILMLAGDVVKGGNQDRVLAHHEVVLPMTVRNVEVFCVEAGRSTYYDPNASKAEKEIAAFKGYYNVASPSVRRAVQQTQDQQKVWDAVAAVTKDNNASSQTQAYTALDTETEEKKRRDAYYQHLQNAFKDRTDVVGMVAVCGDQVLGVDIFGTPELFRKQMGSLLHGYIAESASKGQNNVFATEKALESFDRVSRLAGPTSKATETGCKFSWGGHWVHLYGQ
jgi:hypothetical protein